MAQTLGDIILEAGVPAGGTIVIDGESIFNVRRLSGENSPVVIDTASLIEGRVVDVENAAVILEQDAAHALGKALLGIGANQTVIALQRSHAAHLVRDWTDGERDRIVVGHVARLFGGQDGHLERLESALEAQPPAAPEPTRVTDKDGDTWHRLYSEPNTWVHSPGGAPTYLTGEQLERTYGPTKPSHY